MASTEHGGATVGFLGLEALSCALARRLLQGPRYRTKAYNGNDGAIAEKFAALGGQLTETPRDAAAGCEFLVCTAVDAQLMDDMLFAAKTGALEALPRNATLLLCGTATPAYLETLSSRIEKAGREDLRVVDSPVTLGVEGSTEAAVTILASGTAGAVGSAGQLLRTMADKLYVVPGDIGVATKVHLVNCLLMGSHIATAAEAIGLAARAGLNTSQVYDIITQAAGSSRAFESRVPQMLRSDWMPRSSLSSCLANMDAVVATARAANFALPLGSAAEQLLISGSSQGYGSDDDSGLIRVYLPATPDLVRDRAKPVNVKDVLTLGGSPSEATKIGMIGLGAMGQGMAASLVRAGFVVQGFDVLPAAIEKFVSLGPQASAATSPAEAARGVDVVILMVQNASQVNDVLFGSGKGADALPDGAIIILSSTVPPSFVRDLESRLRALDRGFSLVDAPVSGGVVRAANGTLTMICSAEDGTLSKVKSVLLAMAGVSSNLCHVEGGVGAASSVKLVNQLLAGVHIATAAEAMAFAAHLNLDTRLMFDVLKSTGAWSWMLENRVPQMLEADWTPHSALAIFVKDLGIVLDEAKRLQYYVPIASAAHNLYLAGASRGWSKESDAGVVRLWEVLGISVAEKASSNDQRDEGKKHSNFDGSQPQPLPAKATLDSLPPEYGTDVIGAVRDVVESRGVPTLVVLDDDPTGTQTCHDIDVLTVWDTETLEYEFNLNPKGFFILTNSRALPSAEARRLIVDICEKVSTAAERAKKTFEIVLRGDSTLRGHLPEEPEAAEEALGLFDGWVITPFFSQGGRLTINDVHYVKEGDVLIPASQTPFAQDATFGYKNSNLRQYVLEKCGSRFQESSFLSVTLDDIRLGGPSAVAQRLLSSPSDPNRVIIVNAVAESDMHVFVAGLLEAEKSGRRYLYRTGAAFVSSRLGITSIPPLTLEDLGANATAGSTLKGGLIVAGSYVPKTTAQLRVLRERRGDKLAVIELDVAELIAPSEEVEALIGAGAAKASQLISAGHDVLVMTSRTLIKGHDGASSLQIGSKAAHALVRFVESIEVRPRYLIAKGGITSSDAATKGLRMRRARILGQAAPGVPLWRCDEETSRHRGVPFVVFPGNVGSDNTLAEVVEAWAIREAA